MTFLTINQKDEKTKCDQQGDKEVLSHEDDYENNDEDIVNYLVI